MHPNGHMLSGRGRNQNLPAVGRARQTSDPVDGNPEIIIFPLLGLAGGLDRIQNELFDLGADLSVPFGVDDRLRITDEAVGRLEREIDGANASLPELKSFVLPGGSERAAQLFLARAVCRRAERAVLAVPETNPLAAIYLNRLSDLLFVLARAANASAGAEEPLWRPGRL